MLDTFSASVGPILSLFLCIAIGYALKKCNVLPDSAGGVLAKLETWVFCPALAIYTMAKYMRPENLLAHAANIAIACVALTLSILFSFILVRFFVKNKSYERNVYRYALTFANSGYFGDPVVLALFGPEALAFYKFFCLPSATAINTWGFALFKPESDGKRENPFKKMLNAPTIATFVGIAIGLLVPDFESGCPAFILDTLSSLSQCMGPAAMLLAGIAIAKYDFFELIKRKKVYVVTFARLIALPSAIIALCYLVKLSLEYAFKIQISNCVLYFTLFIYGSPLGLNTVVFPEAYGEDPNTGASMAMISHTICILTVPLMIAFIKAIFGEFALSS